MKKKKIPKCPACEKNKKAMWEKLADPDRWFLSKPSKLLGKL